MSVISKCRAELVIQGTPDIIDAHPAWVHEMRRAIRLTLFSQNLRLELFDGATAAAYARFGELGLQSDFMTFDRLTERVCGWGSDAPFCEEVVMDEEQGEKRVELGDWLSADLEREDGRCNSKRLQM